MTKHSEEITIRPAVDSDAEAIWEIFREVIGAGDTFAFSPNSNRDEAIHLWMELPQAVCVASIGNRIVGTYFVKTNQAELGDHVCNAGYMVTEGARGKGVGRAMCEHSLEVAKGLGYRSMQFNFVVSTNTGAIRLWESLGFEIVGRLPGAFRHAEKGFVDTILMYRHL